MTGNGSEKQEYYQWFDRRRADARKTDQNASGGISFGDSLNNLA